MISAHIFNFQRNFQGLPVIIEILSPKWKTFPQALNTCHLAAPLRNPQFCFPTVFVSPVFFVPAPAYTRLLPPSAGTGWHPSLKTGQTGLPTLPLIGVCPANPASLLRALVLSSAQQGHLQREKKMPGPHTTYLPLIPHTGQGHSSLHLFSPHPTSSAQNDLLSFPLSLLPTTPLQF